MSDPDAANGAADELGLASVAWRLRTTLADAADVSVRRHDDVLASIRGRSARRRRTKRALGTSLSAFALSITTLALIAGGRVVTDSNQLARNLEPPAVTPGGREADGSPADSAGTENDRVEGDRVSSGRGSSSSCQAEDRVAGGRCGPPLPGDPEAVTDDPVTGRTRCAETIPCRRRRAGKATDSSVLGPDGAPATTRTTLTSPTTTPTTIDASPPNVTAGVTTTQTPPTIVTMASPVNCGSAPDRPPSSRTCLTDAALQGREATFAVTTHEADPAFYTVRSFRVHPNMTITVAVDAGHASNARAPYTVSCPVAAIAPTDGPEWYLVNEIACLPS
jgi:hypothetical protein